MGHFMEGINWDIVRPSLWSGAAGMVVGAVVLSQVFGFMSPSTAHKLAAEESDQAVVAALAPGCASEFRALPDAKERLKVLAAHRDSYLAKDSFPADLIKRPGKSYIDYGLVRACTALLLKPQTAGL
ncbi:MULTISPECIES: hypothetical protein [Bradyrhizobium]|uniref:hypothetical protein n=1 Tax=Bradyrhizobium TaxID=374 RepID=UPI0012F79DDE|nr:MULTISPECIES: hypothetical protein [unclassified Bradyrhizobium]